MPATWSIQLDPLRLVDAEEDDTISDGDEPYLVAIGFRTTFRMPGSTQVFWRGILDDEWVERTDDGDHGVPERMGVLTFPGVEATGRQDFFRGGKVELIGVVVTAFGSDATPFPDIRDAVVQVRKALLTTLEQVVVRDPCFDHNLSRPDQCNAFIQQVQEAIDGIHDQLGPPRMNQRDPFAKSWRSAAKPMLVGTLTWATISDDLAELVSLPQLAEQSLPLTFRQTGVSWELVVNLRESRAAPARRSPWAAPCSTLSIGRGRRR